MRADELFSGIEEIDRVHLEGTEYVVYSDGAYRCAVTAEDWDDPTVRDDYYDDTEGYTRWCEDHPCVRGPTLDRIAAITGLALFDGAVLVG